jgi:hypothetical protein
MALTEKQVKEYREKLGNSKYREAAIAGVADKILKVSTSVIISDVKPKINNTEEKRMGKKNSLNALNDHLMETIEWLTDRDIKGDDLTEQIRRSEAVTKVAAQVINNANIILKAHIAVENSPMGKMKLPAMIEDKTS